MQKAVESEDDRKDVVLKRWDEMYGESCNLDTRDGHVIQDVRRKRGDVLNDIQWLRNSLMIIFRKNFVANSQGSIHVCWWHR